MYKAERKGQEYIEKCGKYMDALLAHEGKNICPLAQNKNQDIGGLGMKLQSCKYSRHE